MKEFDSSAVALRCDDVRAGLRRPRAPLDRATGLSTPAEIRSQDARAPPHSRARRREKSAERWNL